jgi:hypothetical protein
LIRTLPFIEKSAELKNCSIEIDYICFHKRLSTFEMISLGTKMLKVIDMSKLPTKMTPKIDLLNNCLEGAYRVPHTLFTQ